MSLRAFRAGVRCPHTHQIATSSTVSATGKGSTGLHLGTQYFSEQELETGALSGLNKGTRALSELDRSPLRAKLRSGSPLWAGRGNGITLWAGRGDKEPSLGQTQEQEPSLRWTGKQETSLGWMGGHPSVTCPEEIMRCVALLLFSYYTIIS